MFRFRNIFLIICIIIIILLLIWPFYFGNANNQSTAVNLNTNTKTEFTKNIEKKSTRSEIPVDPNSQSEDDQKASSSLDNEGPDNSVLIVYTDLARTDDQSNKSASEDSEKKSNSPKSTAYNSELLDEISDTSVMPTPDDFEHGYVTDFIPAEQILRTRREKILKNVSICFEFDEPQPSIDINKLIFGYNKDPDNYLNEKFKNWTVENIDDKEITSFYNITFELLQFYSFQKDENYKEIVSDIIKRSKNKMEVDLKLDGSTKFYWTDLSCRLVLLLLAYEFVVIKNEESDDSICLDLINKLIPKIKTQEWDIKNSKSVIYFMIPKLVINYYHETSLYNYNDYDEMLKILKNQFDEIESSEVDFKKSIYYYDLYFKIYKSFDVN